MLAPIAVSYVVGGLIPLGPYIALSNISEAFAYSVGFTALALILFGRIKALSTGVNKAKSAGQTMLVGGLAADRRLRLGACVQRVGLQFCCIAWQTSRVELVCRRRFLSATDAGSYCALADAFRSWWVGRIWSCMSVMDASFRLQIGEGGAENKRFASKAPNALTFCLSRGFIEKVRNLRAPTIKSGLSASAFPERRTRATCRAPLCATGGRRSLPRYAVNSRAKHINPSGSRGHEHERQMNGVA